MAQFYPCRPELRSRYSQAVLLVLFSCDLARCWFFIYGELWFSFGAAGTFASLADLFSATETILAFGLDDTPTVANIAFNRSGTRRSRELARAFTFIALGWQNARSITLDTVNFSVSAARGAFHDRRHLFSIVFVRSGRSGDACN